jgi:hypothetical protein
MLNQLPRTWGGGEKKKTKGKKRKKFVLNCNGIANNIKFYGRSVSSSLLCGPASGQASLLSVEVLKDNTSAKQKLLNILVKFASKDKNSNRNILKYMQA